MKKIVFYNFFVFLFFLLFLEGTVRIFNLSNLLGINEDLIIKNSKPLAYKPYMKSVVFGKDVYTDSNGFRVPSLNFKYSAKKSILIIGDSTSFGVGVEEEKTFVGLIRKKFPEINIYNTSLAGHDIYDHVLLLKKFENKLKFERVIYFLNLNDFGRLNNIEKIQNLSTNENRNLNILEKLKKNNILVKINFYLRSKSALYVYMKSLVTDPSKNHFDMAYKFYLNKKNLNIYAKKLNEIFFDFNKKYAISVVILPWEFQTRNNCNDEKLFLPQKFLKDYFSKNKINFIDFSNSFCEEKDVKKMFLNFDPAHLSAKGHIFTEELLLKYNKVN